MPSYSKEQQLHGWTSKKKSKKPLKRSPIKKKFKPTGELELFKTLWDTREKECVWCGEKLHAFNHSYFDHIIPKSKSEALRLEPTNIRILCVPCHYIRHNGTKEQIKSRIKLT